MGKTTNFLSSRWFAWLLLVVTVAICGGIIASPWGPENRPAQDIAIVFSLPLILSETIVGYGVVWLLDFCTRKYAPYQGQLLSLAHSWGIRTIVIRAAGVLLLY